MQYLPIIGLEIHIELKTKSKMFCSCPNDPNEQHPNVNICPICLGHPGTLPVINQAALSKVIKTGLALNFKISEYSQFDRKNYFYPDLPKGYQISQYALPLCQKGSLKIGDRKVRIKRIHLEEDTGKLIHEPDFSLVDFNRVGIPLMELVTEPDLRLAQEARQFAQELQLILRYLNVSDADMEKGQMRIEANISIQKDTKSAPRVEIKNLNSFLALEKALNFEIQRQTGLLKRGKKVKMETRGWDETKGVTLSQRVKEEAADYRYFPEPDLPPLHFTNRVIKKIWSKIPELPQAKRERFKKEYALEDKETEIFVQNKDLSEYFEKVLSELRERVKEIETKPKVKRDEFLRLVKLASNYTLSNFLGLLKKTSVTGENFRITPENFAEFITLIYEGKLSSKMAKNVLEEMFRTGADPSHIVKKKQLIQITSEAEIEKIVKEVISKNPKAVEDFRKGKTQAFQFLVGQIMAETQGKASPDAVNKVMRKFL